MHDLLSAGAPVALVLVGLLPALEASFFLGIVFPGEIAVIAGGVLASAGRLPLWAVIAVAVGGAIAGDATGYLIGRRFGPRLLASRPVQKLVRPERIAAAQRYLRQRGGRAVFFGRFTAALRALIPGLSGMSGVRPSTFFTFNVLGGACWATGCALLGYLAGAGWRHAESVAGGVGVALLVLLVASAMLGHFVRRGGMTSLIDRLKGNSAASRFLRDHPAAANWLLARMEPRRPAGLPLTIAVLTCGLFAWASGGVMEDVLSHDGVAVFDRKVDLFLTAHRMPDVTAAAQVLTWLGSAALIVALTIFIAGAYWLKFRRTVVPVYLVASVSITGLLTEAAKFAVDRSRPPLAFRLVQETDPSFPSAHAALSAAFYLSIALLVTMNAPARRRALAVVVAVMVALVVGASRLYLGVHWPSDVLAGLCIGGMVTTGVEAGRLMLLSRRDDEPPHRALRRKNAPAVRPLARER
jgi:undecaprenyl-diphosphatase